MIGYTGLLKIELPAHTVLLSDAGFTVFGGETYTSYDSVLGSLSSVENMSEGDTGEITALDLSFNLPGPASIPVLSIGALQRSTVRLWLAKYTVETGLIYGTPELQFIGQVDQPALSVKRGEYTASISAVAKAEWLFEKDIGNTLSSAFHKDIFPGELGHDNATGLGVPVAWGTQSQGGGSSSGGGGNARGPFGGAFER